MSFSELGTWLGPSNVATIWVSVLTGVLAALVGALAGGLLAKKAAVKGAERAAEIQICREEWRRFQKLNFDYANSIGMFVAMYMNSLRYQSIYQIEEKELLEIEENLYRICPYIYMTDEESGFIQNSCRALKMMQYMKVTNGIGFLKIIDVLSPLDSRLNIIIDETIWGFEKQEEYKDSIMIKMEKKMDELWLKTGLSDQLISKAK